MDICMNLENSSNRTIFFKTILKTNTKVKTKKNQNTHFIKFFHVNSADLYRHDVIIAHSC